VRLAITLELVALVASPTNQHPIVTDAPPAEPPADLPVDAQPAPRHVPAVTALEDRAPKAGEAGHDTGTATCTDTRHPVREMPAQPQPKAGTRKPLYRRTRTDAYPCPCRSPPLTVELRE
jgi:hypothetical protein